MIAGPAPPQRPPARRPSRATLRAGLVVVLAGALFLVLTLYQLDLPGLYYDEAWDAVSTMHIVQGLPVELERGAHVALFGRDWPLMLDDYQGIISTYLLIPFFLIGGVNVLALRLFPVLSGLLAIGLCYALARAWFGRAVACCAVLLFALSPSWVFWSRTGVYVVAEVVPFTLGALLAFTAWWRAPRGRNGALYLGAFLMGLGLATKLLYVWPIGAVGACYLWLHGRGLWAGRRQGLRALRPAWRADAAAPAPDAPDRPRPATRRLGLTLLPALVCFCAGAFTFLAYNWQTGGTWLKIRSSMVQTEYGANSTTILPNLWEEVDRYRVLLDGGYFWFLTRNALPFVDPLAAGAFLVAALGLLAAAVGALPLHWPAQMPRSRRLLGLALALFPALCLQVAAGLRPDSREAVLVAPGLLAVGLAAAAGAALVGGALRRPSTWARCAGIVLLAVTVCSGLTWLLTGAPDGQARGPFDLRLTDLTGLLSWVSLAELLLLLGASAAATAWQRPLVATLGFLAAVLAQSFPTLSGLWPTHLLVMLPLPQILVGAALVRFATSRWHPRARGGMRLGTGPRRLLAGAALAALLVSALWTDVRYHQDLSRTGGLFAFSDGIYRLANYLQKAPERPIVAAEWGIRRPVQILSQGLLNPEEIFQYGPNSDPLTLAAFDGALLATLGNPDTRYIFTAGTIGPYDRFAEFARVLAAHGLAPVLEHRSYMDDGRAMYEVYVVHRATP